MNKYFLIALTSLAIISLHGADQNGMDIGAERKATAAMQTDADFKIAQATQEEREKSNKKTIHSLSFDADLEKQDEIIKKAVENGLHPNWCVIDRDPDAQQKFLDDKGKPMGGYEWIFENNNKFKETVLNYAFHNERKELIYYLLKKGATKINTGHFFHIEAGPQPTDDEGSNFNHEGSVFFDDIVVQYLYDKVFMPKLAEDSSYKLGFEQYTGADKLKRYLEDSECILTDIALGNLNLQKEGKDKRVLADLIGLVATQYEDFEGLGAAISLLICAGASTDQISKGEIFWNASDIEFFEDGKNFDECLAMLRSISDNSPEEDKEKLVAEFQGILDQVKIAKNEIADRRAHTRASILEHIKIRPLASIIDDYLDGDVLCDSYAAGIARKEKELRDGLEQLENQYQAGVEAEHKRRREQFQLETGIDLEDHAQSGIGQFAPESLSCVGFGDDLMDFGLSSNLHNGMESFSYTKYQPMLLSSSNGMSQSSSSHNGLSNSNGSHSTHNGSQSSSSNADWMRMHNTSKSSDNGLSNSSPNGSESSSSNADWMKMQGESQHSSCSSDAFNGKGPKRKFDDEEDQGNSSKRLKTENSNSSSSTDIKK